MKKTTTLAALLCAAMAAPPVAADENLHRASEGTVVESSFVLAGKTFPLPPGRFTLIWTNAKLLRRNSTYNSPQGMAEVARESSNLAEVILVQAAEGRVRAWVHAVANADEGRRWAREPCSRAPFGYHLDRAGGETRQDCVRLAFTQPFIAKEGDPLSPKGVTGLHPAFVQATVLRINGGEYWRAAYAFNPEFLGAEPGREARFADHPAVVEVWRWARELRYTVEQGFIGQPLHAAAIPALRSIR